MKASERAKQAGPNVSAQAVGSVLHCAPAIESSSERDSMARKRYQKGFVYLDGDKWKGRYREDVITG